MTLVEELQRQLDEARATIARYENARIAQAHTIDHLNTLLGRPNLHPDADKCQCQDCIVYSANVPA